ncbi:FusB/FusC family EF-G-binding protein [Neobacillus jeddahensis]|uniref:FusB/FusC family EF-G-binding protein n=1 Tax=Neobacillus jeddahensis TaxID=1461580 RepID=UPI00058D2EAB|nr:elongation factor G-binding protein [Neobacillus jeddahensis]
MTGSFMQNNQFNFIKKQVDYIKESNRKNSDPSVIRAVRQLAQAKIVELFPAVTKEQMQLLDFSHCKTDSEFDQYLQQLDHYLIPISQLTEQQIKKLFPKAKKLKVPDLSNIDYHHLTYLSWTDISTNKKYIVYENNQQLLGIECKYTIVSKKNICSFCNSFGEVAYLSTITKAKKAKNPDYYKAIGNFICVDSTKCNRQITSLDYLNTYLQEALNKQA